MWPGKLRVAKRWCACLCLLALCLPAAQAETVYRSVDDKGVVEFSDQSRQDAEEIKLQNVPTVTLKKADRPAVQPASPTSQAQTTTVQIQVIRPAMQETIHSNPGDVSVVLQLAGSRSGEALRPGEKILISLNGQTVAETDSTSVELNNIDRGTHQLQARLTDATGQTLAESPVVEFYMRRFSKLFKKPANPVKTP
ncbi:MAG: DUF4124 domain-containing protein [Gammaproteobacteria bacterium]